MTARLTCALCGRKTLPAVLIGAMPVGPQCARKAGLMEPAAKRKGLLSIVTPRRRSDVTDPQLELALEE